jgi:hypothetical protein
MTFGTRGHEPPALMFSVEDQLTDENYVKPYD